MAEHRHKRETTARRIPRASFMAAPVAVLVTLSAVTVGVATGEVPVPDPADSLLASGAISQSLPERAEEALSRSFDRSAATGAVSGSGQLVSKDYQEKLLNRVNEVETRRAVRRADEKLWASEDLNLWTAAGKKAKKAGEVDAGDKLLVTGRVKRDRAEIVLKGDIYWVTREYLSDEEPIPGIGGTCSNGTSVRGAGANIVKVHAAVCAAFPNIGYYGALRGGGGDHGSGRAVDIMVSGAEGQKVADFVRANAAALGVSYVIFAQRIWSVERGGEGWRGMSNRGSATANHYDHVHVSTF